MADRIFKLSVQKSEEPVAQIIPTFRPRAAFALCCRHAHFFVEDFGWNVQCRLFGVKRATSRQPCSGRSNIATWGDGSELTYSFSRYANSSFVALGPEGTLKWHSCQSCQEQCKSDFDIGSHRAPVVLRHSAAFFIQAAHSIVNQKFGAA